MKVVSYDHLKTSMERVNSELNIIKHQMATFATNEEVDNIIDDIFNNKNNNSSSNTYDNSGTKYTIIHNKEVVDNVSINKFVAKIRDGSAMTDWGFNSQIVIPYTDPVDGNTYDLPFNFGTFQKFEREDGTKFMGLGLLSEYALPSIDIVFDDKEPSNPNDKRRDWGNNRWMYSNLRQWLNKSDKHWYEPQHKYDAAPTKPNPETVTGFLDCLPNDFVDACIPIKNVTKTPVSVDGGNYDTTYDKFFPLSLSQYNCKCTNVDYGLNDESEGVYWEYCRNKMGVTNYMSGNGSNDGDFGENILRKIYAINNPKAIFSCCLRSANLYFASIGQIWIVSSMGCVGTNNASTNIYRIAPACVIG